MVQAENKTKTRKNTHTHTKTSDVAMQNLTVKQTLKATLTLPGSFRSTVQRVVALAALMTASFLFLPASTVKVINENWRLDLASANPGETTVC